ncbi:MAG: hypothetical protein ACI82F_001196 [Planctomycetota bacterium]|jgi:hypothetical protein
MVDGKQIEERYTGGEQKGYPWFVIVDSGGKALADSDGPDGNIGCPVSEVEATHLFSVLRKTRQRLTDEEMKVLRKEHAAFAKVILDARSGR